VPERLPQRQEPKLLTTQPILDLDIASPDLFPTPKWYELIQEESFPAVSPSEAAHQWKPISGRRVAARCGFQWRENHG
jgi:hypothetical protein